MGKTLDIGCGRRKEPGSIGLDYNVDATAADLIADLNQPLPFADNTFDLVRAVHVIEHLNDVIEAVDEIHRITKRGGAIYLVTPHHTDAISWRDPTHRWHLNSFSFQYWDQFHGERHWYTRKQLRPVSVHVELARMWKWMGFQWFVNHFDWYRRFWEHYMCFIVRGKQMEFVLEVVK